MRVLHYNGMKYELQNMEDCFRLFGKDILIPKERSKYWHECMGYVFEMLDDKILTIVMRDDDRVIDATKVSRVIKKKIFLNAIMSEQYDECKKAIEFIITLANKKEKKINGVDIDQFLDNKYNFKEVYDKLGGDKIDNDLKEFCY